MKCFVTGAAGMLGSDICEALAESMDVTGAGKNEQKHLRIPYTILDFCDRRKTRDLILSEKPDLIFHTAAMTDVDGCESDIPAAESGNVEATKSIADAGKEAGSFLIFISTDYVFDGKKAGQVSESDRPNPVSVYGRTKWAAEKYVLQNTERRAIFRLAWLYGRHGKSFPRTVLNKARETDSFRIVSDQVGRPTYTKDIAGFFKSVTEKHFNILEKNSGEIFHVANDGYCSWADFAAEIFRIAGLKQIKIERISSKEINRPAARPANSVLSLDKTQKAFGIRLRSWQEAARKFVPELMQAGQQR